MYAQLLRIKEQKRKMANALPKPEGLKLPPPAFSDAQQLPDNDDDLMEILQSTPKNPVPVVEPSAPKKVFNPSDRLYLFLARPESGKTNTLLPLRRRNSHDRRGRKTAN